MAVIFVGWFLILAMFHYLDFIDVFPWLSPNIIGNLAHAIYLSSIWAIGYIMVYLICNTAIGTHFKHTYGSRGLETFLSVLMSAYQFSIIRYSTPESYAFFIEGFGHLYKDGGPTHDFIVAIVIHVLLGAALTFLAFGILKRTFGRA